MNILLDTHVFLWMINFDKRMPSRFVDALRNPRNLVSLSTASMWEIMIKHRLGKLPLPESPEIYVPVQRKLHQIQSIPIDEAGLQPLATLPHLHRDPFDRLLISQAQAHDMFLATLDPAILKYDVKRLT